MESCGAAAAFGGIGQGFLAPLDLPFEAAACHQSRRLMQLAEGREVYGSSGLDGGFDHDVPMFNNMMLEFVGETEQQQQQARRVDQLDPDEFNGVHMAGNSGRMDGDQDEIMSGTSTPAKLAPSNPHSHCHQTQAGQAGPVESGRRVGHAVHHAAGVNPNGGTSPSTSPLAVLERQHPMLSHPGPTDDQRQLEPGHTGASTRTPSPTSTGVGEGMETGATDMNGRGMSISGGQSRGSGSSEGLHNHPAFAAVGAAIGAPPAPGGVAVDRVQSEEKGRISRAGTGVVECTKSGLGGERSQQGALGASKQSAVHLEPGLIHSTGSGSRSVPTTPVRFVGQSAPGRGAASSTRSTPLLPQGLVAVGRHAAGHGQPVQAHSGGSHATGSTLRITTNTAGQAHTPAPPHIDQIPISSPSHHPQTVLDQLPPSQPRHNRHQLVAASSSRAYAGGAHGSHGSRLHSAAGTTATQALLTYPNSNSRAKPPHSGQLLGSLNALSPQHHLPQQLSLPHQLRQTHPTQPCGQHVVHSQHSNSSLFPATTCSPGQGPQVLATKRGADTITNTSLEQPLFHLPIVQDLSLPDLINIGNYPVPQTSSTHPLLFSSDSAAAHTSSDTPPIRLSPPHPTQHHHQHCLHPSRPSQHHLWHHAQLDSHKVHPQPVHPSLASSLVAHSSTPAFGSFQLDPPPPSHPSAHNESIGAFHPSATTSQAASTSAATPRANNSHPLAPSLHQYSTPSSSSTSPTTTSSNTNCIPFSYISTPASHSCIASNTSLSSSTSTFYLPGPQSNASKFPSAASAFTSTPLGQFVSAMDAPFDGQTDELARMQELSNTWEPEATGPLVSERISTSALTREYAEGDDAYRLKTANLPQKYAQYRTCRGDGHCGWRAIAFCYLETLQRTGSKQKFAEEEARLKSLQFILNEIWDPDLYEDFAIETWDMMKRASEANDDGASLLESFNDFAVSQSVITFFKLLTSAWIQKYADNYQPYLDIPVTDFCKNRIDPAVAEIDNIGLSAIAEFLTKPAGIAIEVHMLDRHAGSGLNKYDFSPTDSQGVELSNPPTIRLLYRPGHYDILYKAEDLPLPASRPPAPEPQNVIVALNHSQYQHRAFGGLPFPVNDFEIPGMAVFPQPSASAHWDSFSSPMDCSPTSIIAPSTLPSSPQAMNGTSSSYHRLPPNAIHEYYPHSNMGLNTPQPTAPVTPVAAMPSYSLNSATPFRPSKYEIEQSYAPHNFCVTQQFKNSHYNTAHYNNPEFEPEQWRPDDEYRSEKRKKSSSSH